MASLLVSAKLEQSRLEQEGGGKELEVLSQPCGSNRVVAKILWLPRNIRNYSVKRVLVRNYGK